MRKKQRKVWDKLLGKLNTGTATREEKARLKSLNAKLSRVRGEISKSATTGDAGAVKHHHDTELLALRLETKKKTRSLLKTWKEKQVRGVIREVCAAERVDLAFIIDCTSSMSPYIESVKTSIKEIVHEVSRTNGNLKIRLAVVAYRDIADTERFEVLDFVDSIGTFEAFVGYLKAVGGADTPEDMAGGIQKANSLSWFNPTRIAFLIADCPCHGREFHHYDDTYPSGTPGINIINELRILQKLSGSKGSMSVHFGRITNHTDEMLSRFKASYGIDLQVGSITDTSKLKSVVTSSVRRSIFKTMTLAGGTKRGVVSFSPPIGADALMATLASKGDGSRDVQLKKFSLVPRVPLASEWAVCPPLMVKVYRNTKITSMSAIRAPIGFGILQVIKLLRMEKPRESKAEQNIMFMRRATNPFAQGEIRIAFHGQLACSIDELGLHKNSMVLKSFKHVGKGVHDREQYLKQMEVSNIAHYLAIQYNSTDKPSHCATIHFLPVCVVEEEANIREHLGERRFCAEPPLPRGAFRKFSNNTGYWDEEALDESLLRFTDWTYRATGKYLMVTDLQGVKSGNNKFYLTDPVILCQDIIRFGNTNLGEKFMHKCMDSTRSHMKENGWA